MALSRLILGSFLFSASLFADFPTEVSGQMLYLLHRGETAQAFKAYLDHAHESGSHDFTLLQQAGIRILETGIESDDTETQLMCMFGAGVANSPDLLPILEKGIHAKDQRTQLIAMNYLGRQHDDEADKLVIEALSSPFLLTRLEGCLQLAQKNHPAVLNHLQSLMVKVPDLVRALFPQIVVLLEGNSAHNYLRQLLTDTNIDVRIEAILSVAKEQRDDFLPQIRMLASQAHHAQQECCALALGELKDSASLPLLKELAKSQRNEVKLAAAIALIELGFNDYLDTVKQQAKDGNLFAINALGRLKEGKEILRPLSTHPDRDIRLNATLSLLQLGKVVPCNEILIPGKGDLGFMRISSPGRGLKAWKMVPSAHHNTKGYPALVEQTIALREKVLIQCLELPEEHFLATARLIMKEKQIELIPLLVTLLENAATDGALALLKEGQQRAGEPLIRTYCTLALFRLHEEGPYEEQLISWARSASDQDMIQFKEEEERTSLSSRHELTPEESSRLLVETFETLAQTQNQSGVEALVHAMAYGNPKNRYALAGLLIRTTE